MSGRRSSCSWVMALLALWSMVSLVVVVVWTSWPPQAGLEDCQGELQALVGKMEGARVVKEEKVGTLKGELEKSRQNQSRLQLEMELFLQKLNQTHHHLTDALLEQAMLKENLTALENEVRKSEREQTRLSQEQALKDAHILALQVNLTAGGHWLDSCRARCDAARIQQGAAESERKACQSKSEYLLKQLESCGLD